MKDKDKNRDPERARKRAVADARCALRKLGLLEDLETLSALTQDQRTARPIVIATYVERLGRALA